MMNPLSPFTYYRRHKRRALLLLSLIALTTLGVCVMVRLLDLAAEQAEVNSRYLTRFSLVSAIGSSLESGSVSQIRAHPDVARAIPERSLYIDVPMNFSGGYRLFGVPEADVQFLIDTCGMRLKEGRLLRARTNELLLSEGLVDALELQIGDPVGRSVNGDYYGGIPTTMVLVGILETDPSVALPSASLGTGGTSPSASLEVGPATGLEPDILVGFVSYETMDSHELYMSRPSGLIVVAREGRKAAVDDFLETTISSLRADVWTQRRNAALLAQGMLFIHLIFSAVDCLVATVVALVVGSISQIGLTQRMPEFGLLHAIGYGRQRLIRRITLETANVAGAGWMVGLAFSWLAFVWLKVNVFTSTFELNLANLKPIWFAAPIPLAVVAFVAFSTMRTFARFDPVAIIELGKVSMEASDRRWTAKRSSMRPLSSWTFYQRHKQRGLALALTMALMILGVSFPVFLLAPMVDLTRIRLEYLRRVSVVSPRVGTSLDPGVTARVRTHPAVARVAPAVELGLMIEMPPMSQNPISIHGVSAEDMAGLIEVYGVQLEEGRLPNPRSDEIILSRAAAMNRGLRVGDRVGRPVYENDRRIPTEMEVVGILSDPEHDSLRSDVWTGFASYEYLSSHELYASHRTILLVVPVEGYKDELDAWLEESVASERTQVRTYDGQLRMHQQEKWLVVLLCAVVEGIIAVVAAVALAILSYTFFSQRREEFGALHALGHSRRWLVLRTVRETVSAVAVAWLIGATVCMAGLAYVHAGLYVPKGLTLNFFNPTPWLFTLPMPLAVVFVSAGLVAWMLSRLDPVSVIERRS
jgi:ABC-type antimicrobial peptide transport system permease subunit